MEDSIERYLKDLPHEELERKADRLLELRAHPGWADLVEVAEVYRAKQVGMMINMPKSDVQDYAHLGGTILGMDRFLGLVDRVEDKRALRRERLVKGMG